MNLTSLINDNVTEILNLLIEFTQIRQKLLIQNIKNSHIAGFVPKELDVNEFSNLLNFALDEHIRTNRLVLYDTKNIKFGSDGDYKFTSIEDESGKVLIEDNVDEYFELQIKKLWENSLNQKVAVELLKQKQKPFTVKF
jgi:flagellar basal body rod protein FlgB